MEKLLKDYWIWLRKLLRFGRGDALRGLNTENSKNREIVKKQKIVKYEIY